MKATDILPTQHIPKYVEERGVPNCCVYGTWEITVAEASSGNNRYMLYTGNKKGKLRMASRRADDKMTKGTSTNYG